MTSYSHNVSNPTITISQNAKMKALSDSALSLWATVPLMKRCHGWEASVRARGV